MGLYLVLNKYNAISFQVFINENNKIFHIFIKFKFYFSKFIDNWFSRLPLSGFSPVQLFLNTQPFFIIFLFLVFIIACFSVRWICHQKNYFFHQFLSIAEVKIGCCLQLTFFSFKVACRVPIWKKTFCQNSDKFGYSFIKNDIMFVYLLCIYKKPIILRLFKIDTLNLIMYILTILTCLLKIYVIRLRNLISMNIFFTIKDHSFFLYNYKEEAENK